MNEIPRRSFLALLGSAVVAVKLPHVADVQMPLPAVEAPEITTSSPAYFRRWYVTGVDTRCEGSVLGRGVRSARVRLQQILMTEEEAKKTPPTATIDYRDVISACVDHQVEHFMTLNGPMIVMDMPATAEVEIGIEKAKALASRLGLGGDTVEFVGDLPL